ncbi:hypothetical protein [Saccharothrix texasensis]|uniref:Uncharacterized protein n=1 Tax=Saccharothrix texasensis TaxID=103734 RepID=A0A3N1H8V7_9PSEU|nr:hypothetical protein [Saccharothrix texasensis]ROP38953.1 hypothetical protein EDD40_4320 [Saccharothrix texasensis]
MGQLSFYSAEARQPCVGDLAGLLCGPGRALGFARGRAARVSVGLDTRDRAAAVEAALAERGVQARVEQVRAERPRVAEDGPAEAGPEPAGPAGIEVVPDEPASRPADDEPVAESPDEPLDEPPDDLDEPLPDLDDLDDLGEPLDEPVDDDPDGFAPVVIGSGRRGPAAAEPEPEPEPRTEAEQGAVEAGTGTEPGAVEAAEPVVTESWQVTTAFRTDLAGLAAQWFDGDRKVVPPDFTLDGAALRLWALASGRWVESGSGYLLGLDPEAPDTHEALRKALATSGLPSTLLIGKTGGPALRVVGRRRLERLAELVGRAPRGVAERTWPAA